MTADWTPAPTDKHQDHVVAHVLGASVCGHFTADEAAHFLLDIGFVWTIRLDASMALVLQRIALAELDVSAAVQAALVADAARLAEATDEALTCMAAAPAGCVLTAVECYARADERRILLVTEAARFVVTTSLTTGAVQIDVAAPA